MVRQAHHERVEKDFAIVLSDKDKSHTIVNARRRTRTPSQPRPVPPHIVWIQRLQRTPRSRQRKRLRRNRIDLHPPSRTAAEEHQVKGNLAKGKVHGTNSSHATISLDESSLDNLTELESLTIEYVETRNHISGNPPLTLNPESPLHEYLYGPRFKKTDGSNAHNSQKSDTDRWTQWNYGESIHVKTPDYKPRE